MKTVCALLATASSDTKPYEFEGKWKDLQRDPMARPTARRAQTPM